MTLERICLPAGVESLQPFVDAGVLGPAEVHLAGWVVRAAGPQHPHVVLAVAVAAWAAQHGHACADLDELARVVQAQHATVGDETEPVTLPWPDPAAWCDSLTSLLASAVVRVVDGPDTDPQLDERPLVLHDRRVYLQRYWMDECAVAAALRSRAADVPVALHPQTEAALAVLLPALDGDQPNLQRRAADVVLRNRVAMIVGGPGTGKTYSVARLLAVLLQEDPERRVALAAPTGKAAARLQESIAAALAEPDVVAQVAPEARAALAATVPTTVHRLLGPLGDRRQRFRHDADDPLPHDLVLVDETSMVSLPLLARLLDALRPEARLVLIGDPDQLESVELGAVLGDLVSAAFGPSGPMADRAVRLLRGHRYGGDTPIALLADAIRRGDATDALAQLRGGVVFHETVDPLAPAVLSAVEAVVGPHLREQHAAAQAGDADGALRASAAVRVLCAHRRGPFGVDTWNRLAEHWMFAGTGSGAAWFAGRPLLATQNDPRLGLANGDTGVVVRIDGRLVAVFDTALGRQQFDPVQLDGVQTAYAMTIHKSQGSEYPTVVVVLPPASSPLAGRELVYTGVTRAKSALHVVGSESALRAALANPAHRMTGLADALSSRT